MKKLLLVVSLTLAMLSANAQSAAPTKLQSLKQMAQKVLMYGAVAVMSYCSLSSMTGCERARDVVLAPDNQGSSDELLKEEIGQMLLVGFYGISVDAEAQKIFAAVRPGGVILFDTGGASTAKRRTTSNRRNRSVP